MANNPQPQRRAAGSSHSDEHDRDRELLRLAYSADTAGVVTALKAGADVNAIDPLTGLTALHIAVGTNNLPLTRILIEDWNARFMADGKGRWPTVIAAEARVDAPLAEYIVEAEGQAQ